MIIINELVAKLPSVFFYIVVCALAVKFAGYAEKKQKKRYVLVIIVLLSIVAGLRSQSVGIDTSNYLVNFSNGNYVLYEFSFEQLTRFFVINESKQLYLLTIAIIIYSLFILRLWELREFLNFRFAVFTFFLIHYAVSLTMLRQYIAMAIVFWGSRYLLKQKYLKYIICVIIATSFHFTAIISLCLIGFVVIAQSITDGKLKISTLILCLSLPVAVVGLFSNPTFHAYFALKVDSYFSTSQGSLGMFKVVEFAIVLYLNWECKLKLTKESNSFNMLFSFSKIVVMCGILFSFVGYFFTDTNRIFMYFTVFAIVYYSMVWKVTKEPVSKHKIINMPLSRLCIIFIVVYPFVKLMIYDSYKIIPYSLLIK